MPTIKDVAQAAGVSAATVSYVLNDSVPVSELTRERVLRAVAALGYRPNQRARNLQAQRTYTLGLVLEERSHAAGQQAELETGWPMPGLELGGFLPQCVDAAALAGYHLLLLAPTAQRPAAALISETHAGGSIDGLLLIHSGPLAPSAAIPHVWAGWPPSGSTAPAVICDGALAARLAALALADQGCRRIGLIAPPSHERGAVRWQLGYRRGLRQAGLAFDPGLLIEPYGSSAADGADALETLLQAGLEVDGVIVAGSALAYGAAQAARRAGRQLGRDLRLISGYDGALALGANLTALRWPLDGYAQALIATLVALVAGEPPERRTIIAPSLLVRAS